MTNKERIVALGNNFELIVNALGNTMTEDFPQLKNIIAKFKIYQKYCQTMAECFNLFEDQALRNFADHYDREYLYNMSLIENAGINIISNPTPRFMRRGSF